MQDQICKQTAKIDMTVNDDSDFLSPYAETGKPVISSEVAEFLENSANAFHPKEKITLSVHSDCIDDNEKNRVRKGYPQLLLPSAERNRQEHAQKNHNSNLVFRRGNIGTCLYVFDKQAWDKRFVDGMRRYFCLGFSLGSSGSVFIERSGLMLRKKRLDNFIDMKIIFDN